MGEKPKTTKEIKTELDLLLGKSITEEQKKLIGQYRIEYAMKASVLLEEYMEKEIAILKDNKIQ